MDNNFDFSGWATKCNIRCSDGRIIMPNAFKHCDGAQVPLVWNHNYNSPDNVLGKAVLEHRDDGVIAHCTFNDSDKAKHAKLLIEHGDITALSIAANRLKQQGSAVMHGDIREVSLVLAGANPGASIQSVMLKHGDEYVEADDEAIIYNDDDDFEFEHSDGSEPKKKEEKEPVQDDDDDNETVEDVFNTFTEKQKKVVYALLGEALDGEDDEDDEEDDENMKHNVFDRDNDANDNVLTHSAQAEILQMAKDSRIGTFQNALQIFAENNKLEHDALSSGFVQTGEGNVTTLFPEYKDVRPGAPELITNDQGWVSMVMSKVHKSPISRIRTRHVDIRNIDALRAKGYDKGKKKSLTGNFSLVRRTTDPQTVYVKNALHRDDVIDIDDFDYVKYLYDIDRMMLDEELATSIMIGDGRGEADEDKIKEEHIRPIWLDDDLYTLHVDLDIEGAKSELQGTDTGNHFGENYIYAEAVINTVLYAREKFKGSGTPDFYCTPHLLNVMLLARDMNGRRIYSSKAELASALNVGEIITAEQFEGKTRETKDGSRQLLGIIVNLSDYHLGATKGGEITHFTDFDIDFNQLKSLLETRCSGALTRVYSAIALELDPSKKPTSSGVLDGGNFSEAKG